MSESLSERIDRLEKDNKLMVACLMDIQNVVSTALGAVVGIGTGKCKSCQTEFPIRRKQGKGRQRKFCSNACKLHYFRTHQPRSANPSNPIK